MEVPRTYASHWGRSVMGRVKRSSERPVCSHSFQCLVALFFILCCLPGRVQAKLFRGHTLAAQERQLISEGLSSSYKGAADGESGGAEWQREMGDTPGVTARGGKAMADAGHEDQRRKLPATTGSNGGLSVFKQVLLRDAWKQGGGACLDGSPPAYYYRPSDQRSAGKNWVIYFEGGGWCGSEAVCRDWRSNHLGTSRLQPKVLGDDTTDALSAKLEGILSSNSTINPFWGWNMVYVTYCDGASFSGDVKEGVRDSAGANTLRFRGLKNRQVIIQDLLDRQGLGEAKGVLLVGCSAGGVGLTLACDAIRQKLPQAAKVKCLLDAAFFPDTRASDSTSRFQDTVQRIWSMQLMRRAASKRCLDKFPDQTWKCFYPEHSAPYIKTPVFAAQSLMDTWVLPNVLSPRSMVRTGELMGCAVNVPDRKCVDMDLKKYLKKYAAIHRQSILDALIVPQRPYKGYNQVFFVPGLRHCTVTSNDWGSIRAQEGGNRTLQEAIVFWWRRG